mgnify:CR=1 FL=1
MAITSDGTQQFAIEVSPVAINSVDYIVEDFSVTYAGNRVDIDDSNGEPLGSTIVPQRVEGSATLQYAASTTANPSIGHEFTLATGRNATTYVITEVGDSQTQGDYSKASISFYKKLN